MHTTRSRVRVRTFRVKVFGVSRGLGSKLTKVLEVIKGEVVPEEVKHGVLQCASVPIGEDESVAVDPGGVLGTEFHSFSP